MGILTTTRSVPALASVALNFLLREIDNVIANAIGAFGTVRSVFRIRVKVLIPLDLISRETKRDGITTIRGSGAMNHTEFFRIAFNACERVGNWRTSFPEFFGDLFRCQHEFPELILTHLVGFLR